MSLFKNFATFSIFTFISRIFGFIRDTLIAYKLGTSSLADIFFVAFRVPNLFRSLFAEGAFSSAFVPIYSKNQDKNFVNNIFTILLITLIIFCLGMQLIMPYFVYMVAPGFINNSDKFDMTVLLSRIMLPYLITISLVSLLGGVLQTKRKFVATSAAPIILNICMIFALTYLTKYTHVLYALAFSVIIAGLLQLLLLLSAIANSGHKVSLGRFVIDKQTKEFFHKLIPVVFGAGILQISTIIDTLFASTMPGAVSYLYYAERITQLPLALIGISLSNVLLPLFASYAAKLDLPSIIKVQNKAIRLGLTLAIPAAAALYTLPNTTITCLFAYGKFSTISIENTAIAVKAFATALPAFVLHKILINNYFARGDTKTPALVSALCLLVNIIFNVILIRYYQHVGIVIATSIANWINVIILTIKLRINKFFQFDTTLNKTFVKILVATFFMLLITQLIDLFLQPLTFGNITLKLFVISSISFTGIAVYFSSLYLVGKIKYFTVKNKISCY
ncbi:MAG: murein biosynthesis integral membrane protein MurJ [Rickettsiaceae bacterium H1]|nr:murein biosynthesis integral membrane protein MurJ [Rickettsiaceae bacterium H1]